MNSCYLSFMKEKNQNKMLFGSTTTHKKSAVKKPSVFLYDNFPIQLMPAVVFSVITSKGWILAGSQC